MKPKQKIETAKEKEQEVTEPFVHAAADELPFDLDTEIIEPEKEPKNETTEVPEMPEQPETPQSAEVKNINNIIDDINNNEKKKETRGRKKKFTEKVNSIENEFQEEKKEPKFNPNEISGKILNDFIFNVLPTVIEKITKNKYTIKFPEKPGNIDELAAAMIAEQNFKLSATSMYISTMGILILTSLKKNN